MSNQDAINKLRAVLDQMWASELRLRTGAVDPGEEFERRVRWVASEAVALLDAGLSVALRTDHAQIPAARGERQRVVLLAFLARVEPGVASSAEAA